MSDIEIVRKYYEGRLRLAEERGMTAVADMPALAPPPPHVTAARQAETKARLARMSPDAFIGAWQALHNWAGTEDRAQGIAAPTMVIHGDLDAPFIEPAKWFGKTIPGAVVEVVPETGHSPQFERPALFNAALRRHLERNAGAAAK